MTGTAAGPAPRNWTPVFSLLLFAAVFLAYFPSLQGGLVWNDSDYVTKPTLRSLAGLGRIWTEPGATEQYYPLLHSAFWVEHRLWGDQTPGYHLVTLALHAGASVLFALVLRRLAVPGAWLAAFIFALHPVHVGSVAWITEQKNTLSLCFYLAAVLVYLRFDETRGRGAYALAFGLFGLSLLCKTVTATLPAALLVVLWWRRGRLTWAGEVRPLTPWLVVATASAAFSCWVEQRYVGAHGENFSLPLVERVLVAGQAIWVYAGHLLWPGNLGFIYPRWTPDAGDFPQWLGVIGVASAVLCAWWWRGRSRTPLAVLLLFVGSLFPVLGFVNLFGALYSWVWDHWQYLPDLAPIALFAAVLTRGGESVAARWRPLGPVLAGLLVVALGGLTWRHTGMFRDEETLYRATLARNPSAWMALNNLGNLLAAQPGHRDEAIADYQAALRLRPDYTGAHNNLANLLAAMPGREEEACFHYEQALRLRPDHYTAHANLAGLLARLPGRQAEALAHYHEVLRLRPDYAEGHVGLANLLAQLAGGQPQALAHYRQAIHLKPDSAVAHNGLGLLLAAMPGRQEEALAECREALRLNPRLPEAHNNLANLLARLPGHEAEARTHYEQALILNPRLAAAHNNLANLLAVIPGRESEAVAHYETALGINPDYAQARANLSLLQARLAQSPAATGVTPARAVPPAAPDYDSYPVYRGDDLGLTYRAAGSRFKLWAPTAKRVVIHLYAKGEGGQPLETLPMNPVAEGAWEAAVNRDLQGLFYTYQVETPEARLAETPGIHAKAVGVNGRRAAIIDPARTNPAGWERDVRPPLPQPTDIILYEVQVRDFTIAPNSGSSHPGQYLGMVEAGTKNAAGQATGIDHLRELGVTHVHLLPVFDHRSIDETRLGTPQYNWGYDPKNYNVPEGSFATDPYDPARRIVEFKQMVLALHARGLRVIMDVVYNHTGETENSNFNLEVPGYYYRHTPDGGWSNATACGNETASERAMMRRYMIESCKYWVTEYHVDGFRFDLMGVHDIETMNRLADELRRVEPTVFLYGEGWTAGASPLPDSQRALKANAAALKHIAVFSDDLRDGLKGSVFEDTGKGFVNGADGAEESVKFGIVAATPHPQVDYAKVNYSKAPWAAEPEQCINYVSCHDNQTLYDKLVLTSGGTHSAAEIELMDKLANAIVLTSQGVPFLHAGEEMLRTKGGESNSFNKPDAVNRIDWDRKRAHAGVFQYYQGLIALRKAHPAFRMNSAAAIRRNLRFIEAVPPHVIAYTLDGRAAGDAWGEILVAFNANRTAATIAVPPGRWRIAVTGAEVDLASPGTVAGGELSIPGLSSLVLHRE